LKTCVILVPSHNHYFRVVAMKCPFPNAHVLKAWSPDGKWLAHEGSDLISGLVHGWVIIHGLLEIVENWLVGPDWRKLVTGVWLWWIYLGLLHSFFVSLSGFLAAMSSEVSSATQPYCRDVCTVSPQVQIGGSWLWNLWNHQSK
jgi:hypothetical protein